MPYKWDTVAASGTNDAVIGWHLMLWPHRSLSPEGFVTFFSITFLLLLVPLFAVLGSPVLWGLLPFLMGTLALTWYLIRRSWRDGSLREDLLLDQDHIEVVRREPSGTEKSWQANPYWVRVKLHESGGPVENYLTLEGSGRMVEIGAFLSPEERISLYTDLTDRLARLGLRPR
ncbi:DUF2244 domain-containing protein [Pseudoruegeria sp. HB172150]|uniref:DUF2244 domain-containing protein n=1 Tax=Pseudoruegeria sp. HB172150 TaxID=2721164 RepID=UPI00155342B7|nr:DUF2244 domain-containing protein [Pseudoruegeria sp. HB172150]